MNLLERTKALLHTQDNRATAHPIFIVQQRKRIYGMDENYFEDNVVWLYEDEPIEVTDEAELAEINEKYDKTFKEPEGYTRTAYLDIWEFVTACFTNQACEDYIKANGHNLTDPRIYVESAYRNAEWQTVREHLMDNKERNNEHSSTRNI